MLWRYTLYNPFNEGNAKSEVMMMRRDNFLTGLFVVLSSLVFMACSSGSDSDSGSSNAETDTKNSDGSVATRTLVDSPIANVDYYCDGKEAQQTTSTGAFLCQNPPVQFQIGKLILGKITRYGYSNTVFPQDLVGVSRNDYNNTKLVDLVRLLQSLDDDGVIGTTINIPSERASSFGGDDVNTKTIVELADLAGVPLVSEAEAIKHLKSTIINVERDIGQWGLDGMHLWMTGCWYKPQTNPSSDSYAVTITKIDFQNSKARFGSSKTYLYPYSFFDNKLFQIKDPNNALVIDAKGLGKEYYKDSLSKTKDVISLWATEAEAKEYQNKVGDGGTQHRTCTLGAGFNTPGLFW